MKLEVYKSPSSNRIRPGEICLSLDRSIPGLDIRNTYSPGFLFAQGEEFEGVVRDEKIINVADIAMDSLIRDGKVEDGGLDLRIAVDGQACVTGFELAIKARTTNEAASIIGGKLGTLPKIEKSDLAQNISIYSARFVIKPAGMMMTINESPFLGIVDDFQGKLYARPIAQQEDQHNIWSRLHYEKKPYIFEYNIEMIDYEGIDYRLVSGVEINADSVEEVRQKIEKLIKTTEFSQKEVDKVVRVYTDVVMHLPA